MMLSDFWIGFFVGLSIPTSILIAWILLAIWYTYRFKVVGMLLDYIDKEEAKE